MTRKKATASKPKKYIYVGAVAAELKRKGDPNAKPLQAVLPVEIEIEDIEEPTAEAVVLEAFCEAGEQADEQLDNLFPDRKKADDDDDDETDDDDDESPLRLIPDDDD